MFSILSFQKQWFVHLADLNGHFRLFIRHSALCDAFRLWFQQKARGQKRVSKQASGDVGNGCSLHILVTSGHDEERRALVCLYLPTHIRREMK